MQIILSRSTLYLNLYELGQSTSHTKKQKTTTTKKNNIYISTWSYENRVSKHVVIFLNFPCLIACLLCCLLMSLFFVFLLVFWLGICVEVELDKVTILSPPPRPRLRIFSLPIILSLNTSDSYLKSARA